MSNDFIKKTSIPLPDGGDTHFHPWDNNRGITATTRIPGCVYPDHQSFKYKDLIKTPTDPSGLKYFDK